MPIYGIKTKGFFINTVAAVELEFYFGFSSLWILEKKADCHVELTILFNR
jgi:hypothetical protein